MLNDGVTQRWWRILSRLNRVEVRRESDLRVLWQVFLAEHIRPEIPPYIQLRRVEPQLAREVGPPCPACGEGVSLDQGLCACTGCLEVYHRGCLERLPNCLAPRCQDPLNEPGAPC